MSRSTTSNGFCWLYMSRQAKEAEWGECASSILNELKVNATAQSGRHLTRLEEMRRDAMRCDAMQTSKPRRHLHQEVKEPSLNFQETAHGDSRMIHDAHHGYQCRASQPWRRRATIKGECFVERDAQRQGSTRTGRRQNSKEGQGWIVSLVPQMTDRASRVCSVERIPPTDEWIGQTLSPLVLD